MIDGWLVKASLGGTVGLWLVKGYVHPEDFIIAIPYKREALIPSWLVSYLSCIGRYVPLVPRRNVIAEINPFSVFRLREKELPRPILELINILKIDFVGLTGSWALGEENKNSDVDLIIYTSDSRKSFDILKKLKKEKLIFQCRTDYDMLNKVKEQWIVEEYKNDRVLESCYKGVPYTIRFLRFMNEIPCSEAFVSLGRIDKLLVRIIDNNESYLVPARYKIKIIKGPDWLLNFLHGRLEIFLETWRTRYQELKTNVFEILFPDIVLTRDEVVISVDPQGRIRRTDSWNSSRY